MRYYAFEKNTTPPNGLLPFWGKFYLGVSSEEYEQAGSTFYSGIV
jgi:hypothetical protein